MVTEVEKNIKEINVAIADWKIRNAEDPKYLVLTISQRQALKIAAGAGEIDIDPALYMDIQIIKDEETLTPNNAREIIARVYDALSAEYKAIEETNVSQQVMNLRRSRYQLLKYLVEGK